jgi:hypothetical protein
MSRKLPPYNKKERVMLKHNGRTGTIKRCIFNKYGRYNWWVDVEWDDNGGIITPGIDASVIQPLKKRK